MAPATSGAQVLSKVICVVLTLLWLKLPTASCETVYFDKYGHCQRSWKPFDLDDDVYTLKSTGGNDAYNSMKCSMTFRAPPDYGVCLTFEDFDIKRCDVTVEIYNSKSDTETAWRTLSCFENVPSPMCTSSRYVTVKVSKARFAHYDGYEFEIEVEKSNSVSGDRVLFASIGIFVGIVLGVVAFIAILAGVVLYCCYLQTRRQANPAQARGSEKGAGQSSEDRCQQETLIEPSAPPVDEVYRPNQETGVLPLDHHPAQDLPPPYVLPPPYEEQCSAGRSSAPPLQQGKS
ncbi:hypothetical protein RRG08_060649 [Elysia crispata]|uniref:CUB domain-containing protein n=1 Tax=Elysia crispata TaxID=231223 RepID=A0AAE1AS16_9GAST|nr:hypothetical protein RRG08_060649 [Elysia crispata]